MANFDLISEDDFFSGEDKEKSKPGKPHKPQADEDLFAPPSEDNESLPEINLPESGEQPETNQPDKEEDFSADIKDSMDFGGFEEKPEAHSSESVSAQPDQTPEGSIEYEDPPSAEQPQKETYDMLDYYDDKQEKVNFKPFLFGFIVVVVLVVLGYFGKMYFLDKPEAERAALDQEKAETAEQVAGPTPEEIKKANFLSTIAGTTKQTTNNIFNVAGVATKQAKLSSMLFYADDFMFEVFAKDRDALAKLNIAFKNSFTDNKINVISSENRRGSNGGVLGIYKFHVAKASGVKEEVSKPLASEEEAKTWLSFLAKDKALKLTNYKSNAHGNVEGFRAMEISAYINGDQKACLDLIKTIGSANKNIRIHKLSLNATDQRSFQSKKYQLRLIVHLFV